MREKRVESGRIIHSFPGSRDQFLVSNVGAQGRQNPWCPRRGGRICINNTRDRKKKKQRISGSAINIVGRWEVLGDKFAWCSLFSYEMYRVAKKLFNLSNKS